MPIHACIQQIYMIAIKHLAPLMLKKRKLENHQQSIFPTKAKSKTTYTHQNLETEFYNMMPKPNQLTPY